MQYAKHYSLEEAQAKLREILPQIEELTELKRILDRKGYDVYKHQYFGGMGPNGQKAFPQEMERLVQLVSELSAQSIEVKDLSKGLIDFPHVRSNGEEVYLCYLLGEPSIIAWHSLQGGFAGRQDLDRL